MLNKDIESPVKAYIDGKMALPKFEKNLQNEVSEPEIKMVSRNTHNY